MTSLMIARKNIISLVSQSCSRSLVLVKRRQDFFPISNQTRFCAFSPMQQRIQFSNDFFFRQLFDEKSWTYSYLLADATTKEAIIIDPGKFELKYSFFIRNNVILLVLEHAKRDAQLINELGLKLKFAMNTHCHADHITGSGYLKKLLPGTLSVIGKKTGANADRFLVEGETVEFGNHSIKAVETPGHTDGCMTFILHKQGIAFTGDALLIRGCGRTDFQEGNPKTLYESVHQKILSLPDNFVLYPAHDYK